VNSFFGIPDANHISVMGEPSDEEPWFDPFPDATDALEAEKFTVAQPKIRVLSTVNNSLQLPAMTTNQLLTSHESMVDEVSTAFAIDSDSAFELLRLYSWRVERLMDDYTIDAQKLLSRIPPGKLGLTGLPTPDTCAVCLDDFGAHELLHLGCGHAFCAGCWRDHIRVKLEGGARSLECIERGCHRPIPLSVVGHLCGDRDTLKYHINVSELEILESHTSIRCLRADCPFILGLGSITASGVATCRCGARVCWHCHEEAHAPCSCRQTASWKELAGDDSVVQNEWERSNTRPCPKCNTRIEKNGGCNHMSCTSCRHQFCWICGGPWWRHRTCTLEGKDPKFDNLDHAADTTRALRFLPPYRAHVQSMANEAKQREAVLMRLADIFMSGGWPGDEASELAIRVVATVQTARSVLLWSYPYTFYLRVNTPQLRLAEFAQTELAAALDELTNWIENRADASMEAITRHLKTVQENTDLLLFHASA
jgi:hypothetical protein